MIKVDAIIFDFIGTLAEVENYSLKESKDALYQSLIKDGLTLDKESFLGAYEAAHKKYRDIRYSQLVEVNNAIWMSEALKMLNCQATPDDTNVKNAELAFFKNYIGALKLRRSAELILQKLANSYKIGLISNFTHAHVIYTGLKKLRIDSYFNTVLVSDAIGWRKPSPKIFEEALERLNVEADKVVFVGDTPLEDIQGAKNVGMKTVFIPSQFNNTKNMRDADVQPDYYIEELEELRKILTI